MSENTSVDPLAAKRDQIHDALRDLSSVLEEIAHGVDAKSCERCPYMSVQRECLAAFSCVNQVFRSSERPPLCGGQHKIDYRPPDEG